MADVRLARAQYVSQYVKVSRRRHSRLLQGSNADAGAAYIMQSSTDARRLAKPLRQRGRWRPERGEREGERGAPKQRRLNQNIP